MLFNSFEFIFLLLPITIAGYYLLWKLNKNHLAQIWLVITSLFFYGWWNPRYLPIIIGSIVINYLCGDFMARDGQSPYFRKGLLFLGLFFNLGLLVYFKYSGFLSENLAILSDFQPQLSAIVLPLGISFFTFQQIAYLVDAYRGRTKEYNFIKYSLFVTFFPQLIAGPIIHHDDIIPQFSTQKAQLLNSNNFSVGITVFVLGLFKKVVIADSIATFSNLAFNAAAGGVSLSFSEAWVGALSYTIQLYFDFSGYSDMAIGAAYMMGVKLPLNFSSPYQAVSIIDFWRRWHITLSNFLRDYLYIPLGGSRKGEFRRYTNLLITMLIGGLWHGAGWQFIFWGGLHGCYLVINHVYRAIRKAMGHDLGRDGWLLKGLGWLLTFFVVVLAWVFFRAESITVGFSIIKSMLGINGIQLANFLQYKLGFLRMLGVTFDGFSVEVGISQKYTTLGIPLILLFIFISPNIYQIMGRYSPSLNNPASGNILLSNERLFNVIRWRPNKVWSAILGFLTAVSLLCFTRVSEFLYFQF
jgi:alginate O-acetyltransferase complex protein AlgI